LELLTLNNVRMEILGIVFLFVTVVALALLYGAVSWGLVMYKFWYWFLLPVFPSLPQITFLHAVGLMFFIGLFKGVETQVLKKEYKDETSATLAALLAPWLTLIVGWIVWLVIY
jgi:hypothetical protein